MMARGWEQHRVRERVEGALFDGVIFTVKKERRD